ncbi:MAG: arginine deiminase-related protein [Armatimonadota bacterium]
MTNFLMCPPTYYEVSYEINPWMDRDHPVDIGLAKEQWNRLHETLISLPNTEVELMEPEKGFPDLVFTANAGVVHGKLFIPSAFKHPERQGETEYFTKWFEDRGYQIKRLRDGLLCEGAGDVLKARDTWLGGYFYRSAPQALAVVSELIASEVLPIRLVDDRFYHLDTCFCPVGDTAMYYPSAFDEYSLAVLRNRFPDAIGVTEEEALNFSCNAVVVGKYVVMNKASKRLCAELASRDYEYVEVPLSEFLKAGGSARCLTLRVEE